jgi:O-antigen ligase
MTHAPADGSAAAAPDRGSRLAGLVDAGPALLAVGVFVWWTAVQGGFATTRLFPGSILVFGALFVIAVGRPGRLRTIPPLLRAAIAFGALFALVSLTSPLWADAPGDAWDGGNRTVLYVAAFALFALTPLRADSAALLLGVWATGVAAIGVATLASAASGAEVAGIFVDGRLSRPIGYVNANCALFLMAFWPAAVLASRRRLPIAGRAVLLGVAFALVELALLSQSRASLLALPLTAAVAFVLVPGRVRLTLTLAPVAIAAVVALDPMLAVFEASKEGAARDAAADALRVLGLGFLAVVLAGLAFAWADRRVSVAPSTARRADLVFAGSAAALVVGLIAAAIVAVGDPVARAEAAWEEFNSGYPESFEGSHFTGGGIGDFRADYWRVALEQFRESPLLGAGADNYRAAYIEERRFDNEARFPHSIPLAILSSTGLVGSALFLGFVGCALAAYLRARHQDRLVGAVGGAAVLVFVYWGIHGSVDWFWEIPALAAPAFAFLGAAATLSQADAAAADRYGRSGYLVALAALAAAVVATPPWLAARQSEAATAGWRAHPDSSIEGLERASRLNPLSERPDLVAGALANRTGRPARARSALLRAASRNPSNWYTYLELGIAEARLGEEGAALAALQRASRLNPREEVIGLVRDRVAENAPIDLDQVDEIFRARVESRTR